MTTRRRDFIVGAGAAMAAARLPAGMAAVANSDAAAQALMAEFAEDLLVDYPENATALGIDSGARARLKSSLSDRSATDRRPSHGG